MDFILYILKVNLSLLILYGFYALLFRQDTFFRLKRIVLFFVCIISFIYPFIDIVSKNSLLKEAFGTGVIPVYTLPEIVIEGTPNADNLISVSNTFPQLLLTLYFIIAGLLLCRIFIQIGILYFKIRKTQIIELYGRKVYHNAGLKAPFSFFKWILIDTSQYSEIEMKEILLHEETHVGQWHSLDVLFVELICSLCWFNPFVWLIKREVRMNLEYLANRRVLDAGFEATHYQFHLLRLSYHKAAAKLTNNFNVSPLKKRISMMNKKETSVTGIIKYTLFIPLVCMLVLSGNCMQTYAGNRIADKPETDAGEIITSSLNVGETENDSIVRIEKEIEKITKESERSDLGDIQPVIDHMPQFPGGQSELMKWLGQNIVYPSGAVTQGIQGAVIVRFVVAQDGSISNLKIVRSADPSLDLEALRVIKEMPVWTPGTNKEGIPLSVYYTLPVRFKLSE